jgi:hypothetical protein
MAVLCFHTQNFGFILVAGGRGGGVGSSVASGQLLQQSTKKTSFTKFQGCNNLLK